MLNTKESRAIAGCASIVAVVLYVTAYAIGPTEFVKGLAIVALCAVSAGGFLGAICGVGAWVNMKLNHAAAAALVAAGLVAGVGGCVLLAHIGPIGTS